MTVQTLAFVGAAGGVGTTRLTVECGGTLARAGWDVAIFDAAFATQGLAGYVDEEIHDDVTALVTGETTLEQALYRLDLDASGSVSLCPARAPFERVSRAQTARAAERFEEQLAAAALSHDLVLVDTPPINSNQGLAAVNTADRRILVTVGTDRGAAALSTSRERLADIGHEEAIVVVNRATDAARIDADVTIPESRVTRARNAPATIDPDGSFAPAVAAMTEDLVGVPLDLEFSEGSRFGGLVG